VPVDRMRTEHVAGLLDWFAGRNAEIEAAKTEDRPVALDPLDRRHRKLVVSVARQRQVVGTLRAVLNYAIRKRRLIDFNVAAVVELPANRRRLPLTWSPDQVATFLAATADDRLALMWRLVLLRGFRRGEILGLRWQDVDWDKSSVAVRQTVLHLDKSVVCSARRRPAAASASSSLTPSHCGYSRRTGGARPRSDWHRTAPGRTTT
jgi:integrase